MGNRKTKKRNTCAGVSAEFSPDCVDKLASGNYATELDLPMQYRFRIAEHPDWDDRFCIVSKCDDGLEAEGSVYKVQWDGPRKNKRKLSFKANFNLVEFGPNSDNDLNELFMFDEFNTLHYTSMVENFSHQVIWRDDNFNVWQLRGNVDQYIF